MSGGGGAEKEGEKRKNLKQRRDSQVDSMLSLELKAGLNLMTEIIM